MPNINKYTIGEIRDKIREVLEIYNEEKGLHRKITGDAKCIKNLKSLNTKAMDAATLIKKATLCFIGDASSLPQSSARSHKAYSRLLTYFGIPPENFDQVSALAESKDSFEQKIEQLEIVLADYNTEMREALRTKRVSEGVLPEISWHKIPHDTHKFDRCLSWLLRTIDQRRVEKNICEYIQDLDEEHLDMLYARLSKLKDCIAHNQRVNLQPDEVLPYVKKLSEKGNDLDKRISIWLIDYKTSKKDLRNEILKNLFTGKAEIVSKETILDSRELKQTGTGAAEVNVKSKINFFEGKNKETALARKPKPEERNVEKEILKGIIKTTMAVIMEPEKLKKFKQSKIVFDLKTPEEISNGLEYFYTSDAKEKTMQIKIPDTLGTFNSEKVSFRVDSNKTNKYFSCPRPSGSSTVELITPDEYYLKELFLKEIKTNIKKMEEYSNRKITSVFKK